MSNYAYAVTRIRSRRARLLKPAAYGQLMAMELPEIARYIQELEYRREIDRFGAELRGADLLETALAANLATAVGELLGFCSGRLHEMVAAYVERYRVANLKHLLRGAFQNQPASERLRQVLPLDRHDRDLYRRLAEAPSVEALVELLEAPYQAVLRRALEAREREGLQPLEDALDRTYYRRLLDTLPRGGGASRYYRTFVRLQVDVVNLKTVLRLRHRGSLGHRELLIEGGTVGVDPLAAARTVVEVLTALEGTPYHAVLEPAMAEIPEQGLNPVVLALEQYLAARARRFSYLHPLSILPLLDYLLRKEREVRNLRLLVRGRELGLTRERIEQLVVA